MRSKKGCRDTRLHPFLLNVTYPANILWNEAPPLAALRIAENHDVLIGKPDPIKVLLPDIDT